MRFETIFSREVAFKVDAKKNNLNVTVKSQLHVLQMNDYKKIYMIY